MNLGGIGKNRREILKVIPVIDQLEYRSLIHVTWLVEIHTEQRLAVRI